MPQYFEVIDENEKIIRLATREECHRNPELLHKGVYIFIIGKGGKLLLHKRSATKDTNPLKWDTVAEHVKPGELWKDAAKRGIEEELGISLSVRYLTKLKLLGENESELNYIYVANMANEQVKPNPREVEQCKFFSEKEIIKLIKENKTSEWFPKIFETYRKAHEKNL